MWILRSRGQVATYRRSSARAPVCMSRTFPDGERVLDSSPMGESPTVTIWNATSGSPMLRFHKDASQGLIGGRGRSRSELGRFDDLRPVFWPRWARCWPKRGDQNRFGKMRLVQTLARIQPSQGEVGAKIGPRLAKLGLDFNNFGPASANSVRI